MTDQGQRTYVVDGLQDPARVLVDSHGVPHIYAQGRDDVFLAQGFNVARDRLWQIDFWRRRGLGLLAEVFGEEYVETDRAARLFLYRGPMAAEWAAYGPDTERTCKAFTAGVNAFIRLTEEQPELLPPEFTALDYRPGEWDPADVVRIRSQSVHLNLGEEMVRALTLKTFGSAVEDLRQPREPALDITVPDGLDLTLLSPAMVGDFARAVGPLPLDRAQGTRAGGPRSEGSNNWVVSGERTRTGRPILANDPHRDTTSLPGLRYISHLSCPDFDVIGAGEPHLPGISIGHNGTIAFGYTVFMIDYEDLYVYETSPDHPESYRYQDRWEPFELHQDLISLPGGEHREIQLRFTRHGPVIHQDEDANLACAARVAWLEPGGAPYVGSLELMQASDWDGFLTALTRWGTPGENHVYADTSGNIGWKPAGFVPIRPNWDGMLPVPGDGRYEWAGFHRSDQLPSEFNPERGWIATANEFCVPDNHPLHDGIGFLWSPPDRHGRLDEVLSQLDDGDVADHFRLQSDTLSLPARDLLSVIAALPFRSPSAVPGLVDLLHWDHRMDAGSRAALIFEVWFRRHLRPALWRAHLEHRQQEPLSDSDRAIDMDRAVRFLMRTPHMVDDRRTEVALLQAAPVHLGLDGAKLADLVESTLTATHDEITGLLGPEDGEEPWTWGRLSHTAAHHPLRSLLSGTLDESWLQVQPVARAGSPSTVGVNGYDDEFRQTLGSTVRFAFDVGDWDRSLAMNAPGQSGDPRSPFHRNLFAPWAAGDSFPLLYSRNLVEQDTALRILLVPGRDERQGGFSMGPNTSQRRRPSSTADQERQADSSDDR
ncbi:penicillin acylase family protein [Nocardioides sp. AE5]|uniref:penicillin acylase family protein n=1 Tax=Nocardioides sp. AE5 TaxID=2962573 RepID=UPI002881F43C|nr:penicillin acylase family protein [Nocardioides sp. AE5]MDT0203191.1 penicillin acylase family protein [Nocardioides sp. AE5]